MRGVVESESGDFYLVPKAEVERMAKLEALCESLAETAETLRSKRNDAIDANKYVNSPLNEELIALEPWAAKIRALGVNRRELFAHVPFADAAADVAEVEERSTTAAERHGPGLAPTWRKASAARSRPREENLPEPQEGQPCAE